MPKINSTLRHFRKPLATALFVAAGFFVFFGVANAQSVLQGYASDDKLQKGMLVALKDGDETKVVPLTDTTVEKFKGVIVQQNDSPVTISSQDRQNFVAPVGPYQVLVDDEFGPIKKGDYVGISSSAGVAAKATPEHRFVVGVAAEDFNGQGDAVSTITGSDGKKTNVGRIVVDVAFGRNPFASDPSKNKVPELLRRISESIADKPVPTVRIYIGLAILVATIVIAGSMLFSGIRSAVVSIGRNPLSKVSIYRGLIQVILFGLIIFIAGIFGVYLVLKL